MRRKTWYMLQWRRGEMDVVDEGRGSYHMFLYTTKKAAEHAASWFENKPKRIVKVHMKVQEE